MRYTVHFGSLLLLLLLTAACGPAEPENIQPAETSIPADSSGSTSMMGRGGSMMARHHASIPQDYAGLTNPVASDDDSLAVGGDLYSTYCASCHGDGGMGDGPAAKGLDPQPAPIAHTSRMLGDDYLFWRVSEGGAMEPFNSAMIAWKTVLDEDERWQVIHYVRALGSGRALPREGASGMFYSPELEEEQQAKMLAEAVDNGVITESEAALFAAFHPLVDSKMIQNREAVTGNMGSMLAGVLVQLVEEGELSQKEADSFSSIHDRLVEAGLMQ